MKMPVKVFILGGCVSRYPFSIANADGFEVVGYHARTSFSSFAAPPYIDERILNNIASPFQRRMVYADMAKTVLEEVQSKDYDVLLIDMIEERYGLSIYNDSIHTRSYEYVNTLCRPNSYKSLGEYTEKKFEYWKEGFDKLLSLLHAKESAGKMVINKAWWTEKLTPPLSLLSDNYPYSSKKIREANDFLSLMYAYIAQRCPGIRSIEYTDKELVSDSAHKWGAAPFHYVKELWERQLAALLKLHRRW